MTGSEGPVASGIGGLGPDPLPPQVTEAARKQKIPRSPRTKQPPKKPDDGGSLYDFAPATAAAPRQPLFSLKTAIGVTVALYILNQAHCLPKPLSAIVSKCLFWPSLPITVSRRIGKWTTEVDDTVVLGGAPFGFANIPERLYRDYGVRGVVNMCDEYEGPTKKYDKLGIKHLRLRTADHFCPSADDLKSAVAFIREHEMEGKRVYVHCRAGHGRSAAAVFAWLLYKDPGVDPEELNSDLLKLRNVRKTLWKQPSIMDFHSWLKSGGKFDSYHRRKYPNLKEMLGFEYPEGSEEMKTQTDEYVSGNDETTVNGVDRDVADLDSDDDVYPERRNIEFDDESTSESEEDYDKLWGDSSEEDKTSY